MYFNLLNSHLIQKILQLRTLVEQCDQVETINTVKTHLQAAITVIKALRLPHASNILSIARKIAPNTNNETQPSFFSTKKKRRRTTNHLSKPSNQQIMTCRKVLRTIEPIFCGKCLKRQDNKKDSVIINWVQCDICSVWLHTSCIELHVYQEGIPPSFVCQFCNHI